MSTDTSRRREMSVPPAGWTRSLRETARAVAFWLAVALPLAYLPALLVATPAFADPAVLLCAVAGNLVALFVGHGHEPSIGPLSRQK